MTITISTADARSLKAVALLETADRWTRGHRKADGRPFLAIPSASDPARVHWADPRDCTCADRKYRGVACCHIQAVRLWVARQKAGAA